MRKILLAIALAGIFLPGCNLSPTPPLIQLRINIPPPPRGGRPGPDVAAMNHYVVAIDNEANSVSSASLGRRSPECLFLSGKTYFATYTQLTDPNQGALVSVSAGTHRITILGFYNSNAATASESFDQIFGLSPSLQEYVIAQETVDLLPGSKKTLVSSYNGANPTNKLNDCPPSSQDNWVTMTAGSYVPQARYGHNMVWTGTKAIVWGGRSAGGTLASGALFDPVANTWSPMSVINAPPPRLEATAVWTGSEMIYWGGNLSGTAVNTGGRYNTLTDTWSIVEALTAPAPRYSHSAIWTGTEMVVFGGFDGVSVINSGAKYNAQADSWAVMSTLGAPSARAQSAAVWTGGEMIVFGGGAGTALGDGGKYNPSGNVWSPIAPSVARADHGAVWTGSQMIIFGGVVVGGAYVNSGAIYDQSLDSWATISTVNAPERGRGFAAHWTGSQMLIWNSSYTNGSKVGGLYNPVNDTWTPTSLTNVPAERIAFPSVWTGSQMIVWGGWDQSTIFGDGAIYTP